MDREAVAEAMKQRMLELRWKKPDLAKASGVSAQTIGRWLNKQTDPDPIKLMMVSEALHWPEDALQHIADGGRPPPGGVKPEATVRVRESELAALREEMRRLAES